jgi:hypothetical protein
MYRIEDNVSAIKEIQRLLGLNQTGYYDQETKTAVIGVQERNSISKSGIVDYITFSAAVKEYRDGKSNLWNSSYLFSPDFPFYEGDHGDNARRINEALTKVLRDFNYEGTLPRGAYLGKESMNGVKFLKNVWGLRESEEIDEKFMNRILFEIEGIEIKEKNGTKR